MHVYGVLIDSLYQRLLKYNRLLNRVFVVGIRNVNFISQPLFNRIYDMKHSLTTYLLPTLLLLFVATMGAAQPNANFTANITTGCAPLLVQFTSNSTVQNGYTHSWNLGGSPSSQTNPSRLFTTPGTYTVTHTVTGSNGTNTETKTNFITVNPTPTVDFVGSPLIGCPPLTVNFTDKSTLGTSGPGSYKWTFINAPTSTQQNPSNTYTNGPLDVSLTVTNSAGCSKTLTKVKYVDVYTPPTVSFSANKTSFCYNAGTVNFTATVSGSGNTYAWDFGDGVGTSTAQNPTYTYSGAGPTTYTVKLTVTDNNGCKTVVEKKDYIKVHKPDAKFSMPSQVCVGTTVNFTNQSPPTPNAQTWDFGDNSTKAFTPNATHIYYTPGTYDVTLIVEYGNCPDTLTKKITVLPKPNIDFYKTPDTLCPAPQTVSFATYNSNLTSFIWDFGNPTGSGNNSTLSNPTHTYQNNGIYNVTLIAGDANGCKDTISKTGFVELYPLFLDAYSNKEEGCVPLTVQFNSKLYKDTAPPLPYPYPAAKYKWEFDNGDTSILANPLYTYTDTGVYRIKLTVTTVQGCIVEDSMIVRVGAKPNADFTASPRVLCNRQRVFFTNLSTGYIPLGSVWKFGDGTRSNAWDPDHAYGWPGKYDVTLIMSHYGCIDSVVKSEYIEVLKPGVEFDARADCVNPLKVLFTNKSIGDSIRTWYFGDGTSDTSYEPTHTYTTPGLYYITLVGSKASTGCSDTIVRSVYAGPNPPDVIVDKSPICAGDTVRFNAYLTKDTGHAQFKIYVNNSLIIDTMDRFATYDYRFDNAGYYTIKVVSTVDSCSDSTTKINMVHVSKPDAGFEVDSTFGCTPHTFVYKDTTKVVPTGGTNIVSRLWYFGTGLYDTAMRTNDTASWHYPNSGDYTVSLIVEDGIGCKDTASYIEYVHVLKPIASFNVNSTVCVWDSAAFTNISTNGDSYLWNFGDGSTSTQKEPKYPYKTKGVFNPTLVVIDTMGCSDTITFQSVTAIKPDASFTASDSVSVCPNVFIQFTNTSVNARKYSWDFDNGNVSTFRDPSIIFNNTKDYNVRLVAIDSIGCTDTAFKRIQVLGYAGAFSYNPQKGCKPLKVTFNSNVVGQVPSMIWDFGDGTTTKGGQTTIDYTYTTPGKYVPKMVFNDGLGCNASSDGLDTIYVDEAKADFELDPPCEYTLVQFVNKSSSFLTSIVSTRWRFYDSSFSSLNSPSKNFGPAGKYFVSLIVENGNGCKDTLERNVTIHEPVEVYAGADTIKCLNDSVMLMPTGGVSYEWSPAMGLSCTSCNNPYSSTKSKITYTVISTDINGCHDTDYVEIDNKTHVTSIVGDGGEICEGEEFNLSVSGGNTYQWTPGDNLSSSTSNEPIATPTYTTKYMVVAYEGSCIPDTNEVEVVVHPKPQLLVRGEQTIVAGNSADLLASGEHIVRFLWSPSNTLSCFDCSAPTADPMKTTKYTVTVFTDFDCVDSGNVTVTVLCDKSQVFIPNTFTPNGDGMNDVFYVRGAGIREVKSFRIYNRWGEVMFERTHANVNDKQDGWDGTYNGKVLPPDVYVYTVEAYCENGDLSKWKGDVTIIR